ncbi:MAG: metallophosphoesterase [Candidatus Micrarchaeia archaeon]
MPIAYIKSLNAITIADLHLGYEGVMSKRGTFIPKINLRKIKESTGKAIEATGASKVVIDGDIKNEFSTVDVEEFNELYELMDFFKGIGAKLLLVKGNHDNFVDRYKGSFGIEIARQEARVGDYLFFHGEELPRNHNGARMLVMGHEHPAIGISNALGMRKKLRCFLYGKYESSHLLVLPAMNYFASGTEVNVQPKSALLSPVFKRIDIDKMHAIAVGFGETIDFGTVGRLRMA